jgi:hypothetical protein
MTNHEEMRMEEYREHSLGEARTTAAHLVATGSLEGRVRLDVLSARGPEERRAAVLAASVDEYLERYPEESERVEAILAELQQSTETEPESAARGIEEMRAQLISLAAVDGAANRAPAATARLRDNLDEYLATIEGLETSRARVVTEPYGARSA